MSSKWNNAQKLQKTPAVCKKGPTALPPSITEFHAYPLQCHVHWTDPRTPFESDICGIATLDGNPALQIHTGQILGDRARLALSLDYDPLTERFVFTISLFVSDIFDNAVFVEFQHPEPYLPFVAGMFTWGSPTTFPYVHAKIFS